MRKGTEHFTGQSLFYPIIYFELVQTNPKVYPYIDMVDRRVQVPWQSSISPLKFHHLPRGVIGCY